MADSGLKGILDRAKAKADARHAGAQNDKSVRQAKMQAAGTALAKRVVHRLNKAHDEWQSQTNLIVKDHTTKFDLDAANLVDRFPAITVKAAIPQGGSSPTYAIVANAEHGLTIRRMDGTGEDSDQVQRDLKVSTIADFTDEKIDQFLERLLDEAFGNPRQR